MNETAAPLSGSEHHGNGSQDGSDARRRAEMVQWDGMCACFRSKRDEAVAAGGSAAYEAEASTEEREANRTKMGRMHRRKLLMAGHAPGLHAASYVYIALSCVGQLAVPHVLYDTCQASMNDGTALRQHVQEEWHDHLRHDVGVMTEQVHRSWARRVGTERLRSAERSAAGEARAGGGAVASPGAVKVARGKPSERDDPIMSSCTRHGAIPVVRRCDACGEVCSVKERTCALVMTAEIPCCSGMLYGDVSEDLLEGVDDDGGAGAFEWTGVGADDEQGAAMRASGGGRGKLKDGVGVLVRRLKRMGRKGKVTERDVAPLLVTMCVPVGLATLCGGAREAMVEHFGNIFHLFREMCQVDVVHLTSGGAASVGGARGYKEHVDAYSNLLAWELQRIEKRNISSDGVNFLLSDVSGADSIVDMGSSEGQLSAQDRINGGIFRAFRLVLGEELSRSAFVDMLSLQQHLIARSMWQSADMLPPQDQSACAPPWCASRRRDWSSVKGSWFADASITRSDFDLLCACVSAMIAARGRVVVTFTLPGVLFGDTNEGDDFVVSGACDPINERKDTAKDDLGREMMEEGRALVAKMVTTLALLLSPEQRPLVCLHDTFVPGLLVQGITDPWRGTIPCRSGLALILLTTKYDKRQSAVFQSPQGTEHFHHWVRPAFVAQRMLHRAVEVAHHGRDALDVGNVRSVEQGAQNLRWNPTKSMPERIRADLHMVFCQRGSRVDMHARWVLVTKLQVTWMTDSLGYRMMFSAGEAAHKREKGRVATELDHLWHYTDLGREQRRSNMHILAGTASDHVNDDIAVA